MTKAVENLRTCWPWWRPAPQSAPWHWPAFLSVLLSAASAAVRLEVERRVEHVVLVGAAASRFNLEQVPVSLRPRTSLVHGEVDETVPLAAVMDWARPQNLPVTVLPGCSHFFHGQLPLLRQVIVGGIAAHLATVTT